jgi:hypothetical protein
MFGVVGLKRKLFFLSHKQAYHYTRMSTQDQRRVSSTTRRAFRLDAVKASPSAADREKRKKIIRARKVRPGSEHQRISPKKVQTPEKVEWEGLDTSTDEEEKVGWEPKTERPVAAMAEAEADESGEIDYDAEDLEEEVVPGSMQTGGVEGADEFDVPIDDKQLLTLTNIEARYEELCELWFPLPDEEGREYYRRLPRNYEDVDFRNLDNKAIDECHEFNAVSIEHVMDFVDQYMNRNNIGPEDMGTNNRAFQIKKDLNKMLLLNAYTRDMLHAMFRQKVTVASHPNHLGQTNIAPEKIDVFSAKQSLLNFLYQRCAERGYRKHGNMLYEPIYTEDGAYTHAYTEAMDLTKFVTRHCNKILAMDNWLYVTGNNRGTRATLADLAASLELLVDPQLKTLERDRHKFSFKNGLLLTRVMQPVEGHPDQQRVRHEFYAYDDPAINQVDAGLVSAKYFDMDFVPYSDDIDWVDIPTPMLDYIFRFQYENHHDYDAIYRMFLMNIGRMLFDHGDLDDWQYMVDFLGPAGTGKSTVVTHVMQVFYEPENVGILSNKIEPQFGLGGILWEREIFITVGGELDKDCQLPCAMMLQMVANDSMTCPVKNIKNPIQIPVWPTHIATAENEFPVIWKDKGGNVQRRHFQFVFRRRVRATISNLPHQLKLEMPNIIQKCCRAYHHYVNLYGLYSATPKGIWDFCPKYFKENREKLAQNSNLLHAFATDSGRLCLSSELKLSEADFFAEYRDYCRSRGARASIPSKDIQYDGLVQDLNYLYDMNITYELRKQFEYEGEMHYNQHYFFGVGLSSRLSEEERQIIFERNNGRVEDEETLSSLEDDDGDSESDGEGEEEESDEEGEEEESDD